MMQKIVFNFDLEESVDGDALTPVYFDKEVLVKYLYSQVVAVSFASETYGTVFKPEGAIPFGINSKGAIIVWLGDLNALPVAERYHWREFNIRPQNNCKSEFFDAQIEAKFTENPVAIQAINALEEWNACFARRYGIQLYKPKAFEDRIEAVRRYRRIIIESRDDFARFISELNEIINENVNTQEIRMFLNKNGIEFDKGLKGNKLLELVYRDVLGDSQNHVAPFFWLYDLRLWANHDIGDDNLKEVAGNLGLVDFTKLEGVFTSLLEHIRDNLAALKTDYG